MREESVEFCEMCIDDHINNIIKNHLYIEHTLQPMYTAGLYFIFQNGGVRNALQYNGTEPLVKQSLDFSGNTQEMHVQASIPTTSLVIAFIMIAGGITVAILGKHSEETLVKYSTAATAVEAIESQEKFPPFMLRLEVRHRDLESVTEAVRGSLRVDNLVLVHKKDKSQKFATTT